MAFLDPQQTILRDQFCSVSMYMCMCALKPQTCYPSPKSSGWDTGTVITMTRNGPVPSARAWQQAEFSLDGSRGDSEWSVCTSVGSVKGINQRLIMTEKSCNN